VRNASTKDGGTADYISVFRANMIRNKCFAAIAGGNRQIANIKDFNVSLIFF
jgi:hypothetical protein